MNEGDSLQVGHYNLKMASMQAGENDNYQWHRGIFQVYKDSEYLGTLEPEKRLMLAVLTDAVHCYQVGCDAQKTSRIRAFREAEQWLFSAKGYGPFSFQNVCYTLDITPEYLRKMLHKWRIGRAGGARVPAVRRSTIAS